MTNTLHPFEATGLGIGPFRLIGVVSIPNKAMAEHNPDAFNNAMREMSHAARNFGVHCGTCDHCGTGIAHNFVIESADKKRFVVGSDCVAKTGDAALGNAVKVRKARIEREARALKALARREAAHKKWLETVNPATGETNAARLDREAAERKAAAEAAELARKAAAAKFDFMLPVLDGANGNFARAMAENIRTGNFEATPRILAIFEEMFAKAHGRRGSKAFEAAVAEFTEKTA